MIWAFVPLAALIGYLLGSIPVGLWVCRMYGVDIRTVGSGRIGGTNAWRAAGLKAAVPTIIGDAVKGAVAVLLVRWLFYLFFPEPAAMSVEEAQLRKTALDLAAALAGGFRRHRPQLVISQWLQGRRRRHHHRGDDAGAQPAGRRRHDHHRRLPDLVVAHRLDRHLCRGGRRVCVVPHPLVDQISPWPFAIYGVMVLAAVLIALRPNREKLREQKERIITLW
jgi:hypothetical protein